MWPSEDIMAWMHIALNDLSRKVTMQSHCLQNVGWKRGPCEAGVGQESLTTAILANLLFPYSFSKG